MFSTPTLPDLRAALTDSDTALLLPIFVLLCLFYPLAAPFFPAERQRAWIISTLASCTMSLAAIPFIIDYLHAGLGALETRDYLSRPVNRFFQAYLAADLLMGALFYRKQVGLLTGWVHHFAYIVIVEATLRSGWYHIFCFAACMEFPTFLLGLSTLFPRTRSNIAFAVSFFATRIVLHITLMYSLALPANRPGGSLGPSLILLTAFPMHAMWFWGCLKGFARRRVARIPAAKSTSTSTTAESVVPASAKTRHVLAPDIYPDARSLARHSTMAAAGVGIMPVRWPWVWTARLDRLRRLVAARPRMGVSARIARMKPLPPIRPRAMARRMSETLISVLPSRDEMLGFVGWAN
ncbi:hypothetical protein FB45DRAFT_799423 [Roridomyces roridus]|uniref:TLC domain-containing protein n=1 Tax=Roridomyces roridus TaxID=1738132 RepID=A0AAD7BG32_9AGAR|nr:hypothetical protein FB45DRAFT_799423 [Roridomyces roridus]